MRKTNKKIIYIILCLVLIFLSEVSMPSLNNSDNCEAAVTSLSKKPKVIFVGESYQFTFTTGLSGEVSFSSSNKRIIKVTQKGLITGVSVGKAKILISIGGTVYYKYIFKVKLPKSVKISDSKAYDAIMSLQDKYPEGRTWTNDNVYYWGKKVSSTLGYSGYTGKGCMAFAMIASDAAFKKSPAFKYTKTNNIRVGDILRIENDTHSVVVLKVNGNSITIAEGNYNSSIHWGRVIDINNCGFAFGYTRRRPK